jgi:DNA primase
VRKEGAAGFEQRLEAATPLSEFFFQSQEGRHQPRDRRRARAPDRELQGADPADPDGAFRDRMFEMLAEKTTLKWSLSASLPQSVEEKSREMMDERLAEMRADPGRGARRSTGSPDGAWSGGAHGAWCAAWSRCSCSSPRWIEQLEPPYLFAALRQPGIPLLMELIALCRARPAYRPAPCWSSSRAARSRCTCASWR